MNKLFVIGVGYKPLDKRSHDFVLDADVILASGRLMEIFPSYEEYSAVRHKVMVINRIDEIMEYIRGNRDKRSIVLLASGDPMFFGIGRRVVEEFGNEYIEIIPDLSSIQAAFSKIGEPWDDAFLMSLHGGPDPEKRRRLRYELRDIPSLIKRHSKIAVLTDRENNPTVIAKFLHASFASPLTLYVCERLGYPDEKITEGTTEVIAGMTFSEPNVVIITRNAFSVMSNEFKKNTACASRITRHDFKFGLRENEISHMHGLITKDEIRAVTLHKLRLPEKGVFWDIGAGSGSVSIEVARLCAGIKVFTVEKDRERTGDIRDNTDKFGAINIEIIEGMAPDILRDLPAPDRVFIGGGSGRLKETIGMISDAMPSGIMVINAITIETLNDAKQALADHGFTISISEISVSRSKVVAGRTHLSALNPVFIITGERELNDR